MTYEPNSYAGARVCFDADSHILETTEWLAHYADPAIRERLPAMKLGGAGNAARKAIDKAVARIGDKAATDELEHSINPIAGPKGWAAFGAVDPGERSRALDQFGFKKQLVFTTFAGSQFMDEGDPEIRYGGARALNRAVADFCKDDARLMPVGVLPLHDPVRARAELEFALKAGCAAMWIPAAPAGEVSPGHPMLDPIWTMLSDARVPFVLHIGQTGARVPAAYMRNGRPKPTDWLGGGENIRIMDYMVLPHGPEAFLSAMVFDQVLMRFPELRGGAIELGAGWVPSLLRRMDLGARFFHKSDPMISGLDLKPSDYIRRQVRFTPFPGEDVGFLVRETGPDLYLFSSDFPHPEGGRDPIGTFEKTMPDVDEAAREKFYSGNFADMMRWSDAERRKMAA